MDNLDEMLDKYPDLVADALEKWRRLTLERERIEALLYLEFKGAQEKLTADEVKSMVRADESRYEAVLDELKAEAQYQRLYERLLSAKKRAALRTAF